MLVIRSFDPYELFLPMKIKKNNQEVAKLTFLDSKSNMQVEVGDIITIKRGVLHEQVIEVQEGNKALLVSPPRISLVLYSLTIVSLVLYFIIGDHNNAIAFGTLVIPILYILSMFYFTLFKRDSYFDLDLV